MDRRKAFKIGMLIAVLFITAVGLSLQGATTWTVCSSWCDFSSIQEAIDAASGGDMIQVRAGTYKENLRILKTLTLSVAEEEGVTLGAGKDRVTLEGSVSVLGGIAVTIQGFTVENGNGIEARRGAVLTLQDLDILESEADGLLISNASATVRNSAIRNSHGNGITATMNAELILSGSTIRENGQAGIAVTLASVVSISSNTIEENEEDGIYVSASAAHIRNNGIRWNEGCGIRGEDDAIFTGESNSGWGGRRGSLCGDVPVTVAPAPSGGVELGNAVSNYIEEGATIVAGAKTYKVTLEISKSLNLVGVGQDRTVLRGPTGDWHPVINIENIDKEITVMIENLSVTGGSLGISVSEEAALQNVQVSGNRVTASGWETLPG